jgi:thymidylate synthase (FAD)
MNVALKSITPNAEVNIVEIARVSSSRQDKSENPEGLIGYLIRNKHWSPFEHSFLTFEIVTSKAIGIQLLRHRSFTFQEFSQRYAKVEAFEEFELRKQAEKNRQSSEEIFNPILSSLHPVYDDYKDFTGEDAVASQIIENHLEIVNSLYNSLLEAGVAKECARMILPMCTQTTIYMTGSIRSWIHFLDIRDDGHAQKEVQLIAREIKKIFTEQLPIISKALNYTQ